MPITVNYNPAAGLVAAAGYTGGLADYNRYMTNLAQQQSQQAQQERMQRRDISATNYRQQYQTAADQYGQRVGIQDVQTRQQRDLANQDYLQSQSIANQQYMQQQQLANSQQLELMQVAGQRMNLLQQQAYSGAALQYSTQAGFQGQMLGGQINSALNQQYHQQQFQNQSALSSQYADQQAALSNQQAQQRIDFNRSQIQDTIDLMPQMTEAEYARQQSQMAQRTQALQDAFNNGTIGQPEFQAAQRELLANQLQLKQAMPVVSDASQAYQRAVFTPSTGQTDAMGQPIRMYQNPRTGAFDLDPIHELNYKQKQVEINADVRKSADTTNGFVSAQKNVIDLAKMLTVEPDSVHGIKGVSMRQAIMEAMQIMQSLASGAGDFQSAFAGAGGDL